MQPPSFHVGIIGAGGVVEQYHLPALSALPCAKVTWLCDLNRKRAARLAAAYRIEGVYENVAQCPDVDVALLAIPVGCRRPVWEQLFARRWHVLCEKPFAVAVAEHDWIMQSAAAAQIEVGAGFMRRTYRAVTLARQLLAQSLFGPLRRVWASEGTRLRTTDHDGDWYQTARRSAGGGVLMETGCHLIDQVFSICGASAFTIERSALTYHGELDCEARAIATVASGDQQPYQFAVAVSRISEFANQIVLEFDHAQLTIGIAPYAPAQLCRRDGQPVAELVCTAGDKETSARPYRAFHSEWREFLGQCAAGAPSLAAAASTRLTTAFIEDCYRLNPLSSRDGAGARAGIDL